MNRGWYSRPTSKRRKNRRVVSYVMFESITVASNAEWPNTKLIPSFTQWAYFDKP